MKIKKTIADYPEIAAQWHPTKNGELRPDQVAHRANTKCWWNCSVNDDHEWQATPYNRTNITATNKGGCPCCDGKKVVRSNCLSTQYPEIAAQWHPTKNGDLTPYDVLAGGHKRYWWKCPFGDDHEWERDCYARINGEGCPICTGRKVVLSNCLATTDPKLALQWHPTKNGDLTPYDVTRGSKRNVWWQCPDFPDHVYRTTVCHRAVSGSECSCCNGKTTVLSNCLQSLRPDLAAQWHPTKNGDLTPKDVVLKSQKIVQWKCNAADDHEWSASVANRTAADSGCPFCSGNAVCLSNCLATTNPEIAVEWHPTKNGKLTPNDVTYGSGKDVWWRCHKEHEWKSNILSRGVGKSGCPKCSESKGEKRVAEILTLLGFHFDRQAQFKTCKNKRPLRYDFLVHTLDGLKAIEYQGEQHYRPVAWKGSIRKMNERFIEIQKCDEIKRDWCRERNIPLLEIPHWEYKMIESLVKSFLPGG